MTSEVVPKTKSDITDMMFHKYYTLSGGDKYILFKF